MKRRTLALASALAALFALAPGAARSAYPERPVTLVVGFAAGGPTDTMARAIANGLSKELKQAVVVENKPGAGSNIAAQQVARSPGDGYRLLMVPTTSAINQTLYAKPGFDLEADFKPIGMGGKVPSVLVVNPQLPVKTVRELVEYAKANPGKLTFGSSGNGSSIHIAGEVFKKEAQIETTHVPYRGSAPAGVALMGGEISYMFDNVPTVWPHVQSGRMRALAVTTRERLAAAPSLPTMIESGFPGFDVSSWYGLMAPKGTPADVVNRLSAALQKVIADEDFRERMKTMSVIVESSTPESFGEFVRKEVDRWGRIVKDSGATVD